MNMDNMIKQIKQHPEYNKVGMILCHNGVVRNTSRNGRKVSGLRVTVNHEKLKRVVDENKQKEGIIDIQVDIAENRDLKIGDDVMLLAVAGDIRENVIAVLRSTLEAIKKTVTKKTEYYI